MLCAQYECLTYHKNKIYTKLCPQYGRRSRSKGEYSEVDHACLSVGLVPIVYRIDRVRFHKVNDLHSTGRPSLLIDIARDHGRIPATRLVIEPHQEHGIHARNALVWIMLTA